MNRKGKLKESKKGRRMNRKAGKLKESKPTCQGQKFWSQLNEGARYSTPKKGSFRVGSCLMQLLSMLLFFCYDSCESLLGRGGMRTNWGLRLAQRHGPILLTSNVRWNCPVSGPLLDSFQDIPKRCETQCAAREKDKKAKACGCLEVAWRFFATLPKKGN